ncbi:MAG TPA: LysR substrate-binding domain-containing protein [Polyangiaceae bacterium]
MDSPLETSELQALVRAVDAGSLSLAARELGLPRQTLARRLERLEERLGTRLLQRTTRKLALTDAGATLYEHARTIIESAQVAEQAVRQRGREIGGTLRISLPPVYDESLLGVVAEFSAKHPRLHVQASFTAQHVDLVRDADVAFRISAALEEGLVATTLRRIEVFAVASPSYLGAHGEPKKVADLAAHDLLVFSADGRTPRGQWPLRGGRTLAVLGVVTSNSFALLRDAARRGRGITLLPSHVAVEDVRSGRLVRVLPDAIHARARLAVVYANRKHVSPAVRAFIEATRRWARESPDYTALRAAEHRVL